MIPTIKFPKSSIYSFKINYKTILLKNITFAVELYHRIQFVVFAKKRLTQTVGKKNMRNYLVEDELQKEMNQTKIPQYPYPTTCIEHVDLLKLYFNAFMDMFYISKKVRLENETLNFIINGITKTD
jgi:hypothetical protein